MSLGSYTSIPKAKRGKLIDRHLNKYLDVVHLDIGFGDTVSVGGSRYVLVFVDRATRHNWVFGLKTLSPADIHTAFNEFRGKAGRFAGSFCCDCGLKLIGSLVRSYIKEVGSGITSSGVGGGISPPLCLSGKASRVPTGWWRATGRRWCTCPGHT